MAVKEITMTKMPINAPVARLVRGDNESTVLRMKVDRFEGGVDLAELTWMVNVVNAEGVFDAYPLRNVEVKADTISVEWLIGGVATRTEGDTQFELEGVRNGDTAIVWQSGSRVLKIYPDVSGLPQDVEDEELSEVAQLIEYVNTELPSVLNVRDEAVGAAQHPPVVGENGNWFTWDAASAAYVDSGKPSRGEPGETGPAGPRGEQGERGTTGPRGLKGDKGDKGDSLSHEWKGATLFITSASGTSGAYLKGPQGEKGDKGDTGPQGKKGDAGADGLTPYIGDNGHWYIGDVDTGKPSRGADGKDGQPGADGDPGVDGQDGTSPVISITLIDGGHRMTIVDTNGEQTFDILDGIDGIPGNSIVGPPGEPGYTPQKGVDYFDGEPGKDGSDGQDGNGIVSVILNTDYTLTLTFDNGTTYTTPSIRGATGSAGKDGASVTVAKVAESAVDGSSNVITFSDGATLTVKNGTKGADGYTPVKGKDYWTPADQEAIVQQVIAALGTPVFGTVDENKHITLSGHLVGGTYTISFEDTDGFTTEVCTIEKGASYINQIRLSIDADGNLYNGGQGWKTDYRLNSSGAETEAVGMEVTGFIPVKNGDIVRLKNIGWIKDASQTYAWCYDSDFTAIQFNNAVQIGNNSSAVFNDTNTLIQFTVDATFFKGTSVENVAYIRLNCDGITSESIITVNQPIE